VAGFAPRREAAGIRGRERDAHLDGSHESSGSEGREGLRQGASRNRGKNITLIASMSLLGMGEAMCVEGATDALAFSRLTWSIFWPRL
jgi:hypothetical protein